MEYQKESARKKWQPEQNGQAFAKACRKRNCSECCGCIPISKEVYTNNLDKIDQSLVEEVLPGDELYVVTHDFKCIFLNREKNECMIYEDRPQVCRDFGTHKNPLLMCPYLKPNGNPWSQAQHKRLARAVNKIMKANMNEIKKLG